MNIYESRWNNAVNIAEKINSYIDQGYIVLDENNETPEGKFMITETEIILRWSDNVTILYFEKDKDMDHGMHTPIKEYNEKFKDWKFINPKNIESLKL